MRALILTIGFIALVGIAMASLPSESGANEVINYTYDPNGRLILVSHSGSVNNNIVENYTIDKADNRKRVLVTGAP